VAPEFSPEAIEILTTKPTWKKSIRLVRPSSMVTPQSGMEFRSIDGGVLVQDIDRIAEDTSTWKTASKREATAVERQDLELAWHLVARVKSNAIVLVKNGQLIGVGQGQTSRVESVRLAVAKAGEAAKGAVLGSDAFFPFRDGVDTALNAGITAIVQPGGSVRDADTVAACDEHGAALILTGVRHFRH
jgi:phosphoribosylaminoimidazolecarboxamide formyltransferase/IMP cyclohydrolase